MLGRGGSGGMATATGPMGARTTSDGSLTGRGLLDMGLGGGDLLAGSAFSLTRETRQGGLLSFWSRGAQSQFAGREGALSLGGVDAESGAGLDVGSGLVLADASTGLAVDLRVRMLVLHQAEGFRERDLAASTTGPGLRRTWATGCRWAAASWGRCGSVSGPPQTGGTTGWATDWNSTRSSCSTKGARDSVKSSNHQ